MVLSDMKTMKKHKTLSFLQIFKGRQKDNLCVCVRACVCVHVCARAHQAQISTSGTIPQVLSLFFETEVPAWT